MVVPLERVSDAAGDSPLHEGGAGLGGGASGEGVERGVAEGEFFS